MKKFIFLTILIFSRIIGFGQPANDDCSSATTLTLDAGLTCGEDAASASLEGSECFTNYSGGSTESSMWYRITADNDSLVLNFIITNSPNCAPHIAIYGPFASGLGCNPACALQVYDQLQTGDPGNHELITGLTPGLDYLIQIQNNSCGGPGDGDITFCIGMDNPADNALSTGATLIDECGTIFSESTDGGYWNSGTGTAFADLDSTAGNDVGFVINNFAWNIFCSLTSGTWQITVNGVSGCNLSAPNQGIQAAVFSGTQASLTLEGSQSPIAPGGSWTSPVITVDSSECAYLGIDGFAGDVCDYQVTLTNITGGCTILSTHFLGLNIIQKANSNVLTWIAENEYQNERFIIERSNDGEIFEEVGSLLSVGDHAEPHAYEFEDISGINTGVYYRLSEKSQTGEIKILAIKYLKQTKPDPIPLLVYPNPALSEVNIEIMQTEIRGDIEIEIVDLNGSIIQAYQMETTQGLNTTKLSLEGINSGTYLLKLVMDTEILFQKLVIN